MDHLHFIPNLVSFLPLVTIIDFTPVSRESNILSRFIQGELKLASIFWALSGRGGLGVHIKL